MRPEDWPAEIRRDYRESRLATAAALDSAWSMLPPDGASRAAIDNYRQSALKEDFPSLAAHLTVALEELEACAERHGATREFWGALQDVAVRDALYERAVHYRDRATTA